MLTRLIIDLAMAYGFGIIGKMYEVYRDARFFLRRSFLPTPNFKKKREKVPKRGSPIVKSFMTEVNCIRKEKMCREKRYGLIVIGAGMTGLSTALAWAETHDLGREPVLVLEKESVPGGCVTTFARKGYRFDTVQIIPDISELLAFFRLSVDLIPYGECLARLFLADPSTGKSGGV